MIIYTVDTSPTMRYRPKEVARQLHCTDKERGPVQLQDTRGPVGRRRPGTQQLRRARKEREASCASATFPSDTSSLSDHHHLPDLPEPTAPGGGSGSGGGGDERVELRGHGAQADQRQPLLRRQLHQPQPAQPHRRVSTLIKPKHAN